MEAVLILLQPLSLSILVINILPCCNYQHSVITEIEVRILGGEPAHRDIRSQDIDRRTERVAPL